MLLTHPEIPTCADCQTWTYRTNWERVTRGGLPVRRDPGERTPCHKCPKGREDGQPHPEKDLTDASWQAYQHYRECQAVGQFPDDPLVRRDAALIRSAEQMAEQTRDGSLFGLMAALASRK